MKTLTRSMVRHAHAIAREVGAKVILLHADVVEADSDLSALDRGRRIPRDPGLAAARLPRPKNGTTSARSSGSRISP